MNELLDHVIWACADLEHGRRRFESLTGVRPRYGGMHASGLTHNALVGLGGRRYLEILAPVDPATPHDDDWCRFARECPEPRLFTYCLRSALPLAALAPLAQSLGGRDGVVAANGRTTPEGLKLRWQWLGPTFTEFGRAFPFFIDWLDSLHPGDSFASAVPEEGVTLAHFAVGHPHADALHALLERLESPVQTYVSAEAQFQVRLATPRGIVSL